MRGEEICTEKEQEREKALKKMPMNLMLNGGGWKDIPTWEKSMVGKDELLQGDKSIIYDRRFGRQAWAKELIIWILSNRILSLDNRK